MIVSATQAAAVAATAASAAFPPASSTAAPASAVAGCPAAIPGRTRISATLEPTAASAARLLPWTARWDRGDAYREEIDEPHQGREAGDHQGARPRGGGHRLTGGPDRDADAADQPADRASADAQARPPLAPRPAEARRTPAEVPELPATDKSRGIQSPHQGAGAPPLGGVPDEIEGGSLSERRRGVDSNLHPREQKSGGDRWLL